MKLQTFSRHNSGQVLIAAALAIALIICSATMYVHEVAKPSGNVHREFLSEFVLAVKHGSKNVLVSSLANVSVGGENSVLRANLERWCSLVEKQYVFGECLLSFSLSNSSPYMNGFYINWTNKGYGISSAAANFILNIHGDEATAEISYQTVVSLRLVVNGTSESLGPEGTRVNLTLQVSNEAANTLAKNITVYYRDGATWVQANSSNNLLVVDYGNGTYRISFSASIPPENVRVSTRVFDTREILAVANATCSYV